MFMTISAGTQVKPLPTVPDSNITIPERPTGRDCILKSIPAGFPLIPRYSRIDRHISTTGRPIHFMFGYRVGFSGTEDLMALFSIGTPPSWIISNGHISATAHDLLTSRALCDSTAFLSLCRTLDTSEKNRQRLPQGSPHCVPASSIHTLLFNSVSHLSSSQWAVQLVT